MTENKTRRKITIERRYEARVEDVWELWTTKEGIESWWGPGGFSTTVLNLDLRAAGELRYAMTAVGPEQVQFMKNAGMPLTTEAKITYTEGVPAKRLAKIHPAAFLPRLAPYRVAPLSH